MDRGKYRHPVEIWEKQTLETTNELGEHDTEYVKIKENVFACFETRVGGLLNGRPADTVMTSVTHKITFPYNEISELLADKHIIKYRNSEFEINYTLNDGFKDEELQVFVTEKN